MTMRWTSLVPSPISHSLRRAVRARRGTRGCSRSRRGSGWPRRRRAWPPRWRRAWPSPPRARRACLASPAPAARQTSSRAASELGGHVGEHELDRLEVGDGLAERLALLARRRAPPRARRGRGPTASAPMVMRPLSRIARVSMKPWSTSPRRFSSGDLARPRRRARRCRRSACPSSRACARCEKPFMPFSRMKAVMPFCFFSGAVTRQHDEDVADAALGDEHLGAVEDPAVALA